MSNIVFTQFRIPLSSFFTDLFQQENLKHDPTDSVEQDKVYLSNEAQEAVIWEHVNLFVDVNQLKTIMNGRRKVASCLSFSLKGANYR